MVNTYSPAIIAAVLRRKFPEVYKNVEEEVSNVLPARSLEDVRFIRTFVSDFCGLLCISDADWNDSRSKVICTFNADVKKVYKMAELRDLLLGVLLQFYQPERLHQLLNGQIKSGLIKELAQLLGIDKGSLSRNAHNAITFFRAYREFREDVEYIYNQMNTRFKYFDNHGNN